MCLWAAQETNARASLDTGTHINFMCEDVAARIGEEIQPLDVDESKAGPVIERITMKALGKAVTTWCCNGKP